MDDSDEATRAGVHGFHSYAARLHPVTASRLVEGLSSPGAVVLDPFCGSGTVLVEARRLGRRASGADLNPLAVMLARLKAEGASEAEAGALEEAAARVAEHATDRRLSRLGPTRRYGREDLELFDRHVLLELDGLRDGIELEPEGATRTALLLVLSSLLVKVSLRPGDTVERLAPRRLAAGFASALFGDRARELARALVHQREAVPAGTPDARVRLDDARELGTVPPGSVDLVITSPPYPGVYDYATQHAARLRWLGLDARGLETGEVGSRRRYSRLGPGEAAATWSAELGRVLVAIRRTLAPGARVVLVLADSTVRGRAVHADDLIEETAAVAGLVLEAQASQPRPHFHLASRDAFRDRERREHLFLLAGPGAPRGARR